MKLDLYFLAWVINRREMRVSFISVRKLLPWILSNEALVNAWSVVSDLGFIFSLITSLTGDGGSHF